MPSSPFFKPFVLCIFVTSCAHSASGMTPAQDQNKIDFLRTPLLTIFSPQTQNSNFIRPFPVKAQPTPFEKTKKPKSALKGPTNKKRYRTQKHVVICLDFNQEH